MALSGWYLNSSLRRVLLRTEASKPSAFAASSWQWTACTSPFIVASSGALCSLNGDGAPRSQCTNCRTCPVASGRPKAHSASGHKPTPPLLPLRGTAPTPPLPRTHCCRWPPQPKIMKSLCISPLYTMWALQPACALSQQMHANQKSSTQGNGISVTTQILQCP